MMLRRNLLYTAITRAKSLVVLAGSRRALAVAVRTPGAGRRHTGLTPRLTGLLPVESPVRLVPGEGWPGEGLPGEGLPGEAPVAATPWGG
jgi:UvrD-like helicase C-terminal domain